MMMRSSPSAWSLSIAPRRRPQLAEQFIDGREIYVGVIGNQRLQAYTPWELIIKNLAEGSLNIATGRAKWNIDYQKRVGLVTKPSDLSEEQQEKVKELSKRIYACWE
jgi:D-alanine-D-alanine ligase